MKVVLPAKGTVTQGFSDDHQAIDIANAQGTAIVAARAGKVTFTGQLGSGKNDCGLAVQIGDKLGQEKNSDRYCHNYKILVKVGDTVKAGQKIALMGYTGYTIPDNDPRSSHLHWVMWLNGQRVDGRKYISENGGTMPTKYEGGYQQFKKDLTEIDGEFTSKDYQNWKEKYHSWNREDFLITRAKWWRKQAAAKDLRIKELEQKIDERQEGAPADMIKLPTEIYVKKDALPKV